MKVYANQRKWEEYTLLATCDADLMGKTLKQGNVVFHIREDFYGGSLVGLEEAVELIKQSTIINMVGRVIVTRALEERLIHPDAVVEIGGIPHAQIVKI